MGLSLRNIGKSIRDVFDANTQADQQRRIAQGQPRMYQDQRSQAPVRLQAPYALPQDNRNIARKAFDQVNILDNGKTYKNPYQTTNYNLLQQQGRGIKAASLGLGRSAFGLVEGAAGLYDLATPGKGQNRVTQLMRNTVNPTLDRIVEKEGLNKALYKGGQLTGEIGQMLLTGGAANAVSKMPKVAAITSKVPTLIKGTGKVAQVAKWATSPGTVANLAQDTAVGSGQRSARGEDVSAGTIAQDLGTSLAFQGVIKGGGKVAGKTVKAVGNALTDKRLTDADMSNILAYKNNRGRFTDDATHAASLQSVRKMGIDPYKPEAWSQIDNVLTKYNIYLDGRADKETSKLFKPTRVPLGSGGALSDGSNPKTIKNVFGEEVPNPMYRGANDAPQGKAPQTWYHGTQANINSIDELNPMNGSMDSLFGPGVYLTDDPNIASGYANTRGSNATSGKVVSGSMADDAKFFDLENKLSPEEASVFNKQANMLLPRDADRVDYTGMKGTDAIRDIKQIVSDQQLGRETLDDAFTQGIQYDLSQKGYAGFSHEGGVQGGAKHNVRIIWDNESGSKLTPAPQVGKTPINNLDLNMERFKATRDPNAVKPELTVPEKVGKLSDDQMVTQVVNDLGISEGVARKIVANNNKAAIATNLYGSKDLIRGANSPDAYATKVMGESNKRGKAAINQGAPQKPTVKLKENPTVKVGADDVDTVTGEIMTAQPETQAPNIKQFIDDLPDPRQTTRVDADAIIAEGTERLRKGGKDINDALVANGDTYENFYRSIQQASDDVKAGKKPKVSEFHQSLYDIVKPTLDKLRKASGLDTGETPYYLPRRIAGGEQIQVGNSLVDAIDSATMGSAMKRTGKLTIENSDMTPESLGSYATQTLSERYRHSMAVDDLMRAADERGAPISMEQANNAVDMQNQLASDLADAAKRGKEFTNDTVSDLNRLGEIENLPQKVIDHEPGVFAQSPENMLKKAGVWEDGFKQYDYAHGYGNEFVEVFTKNNIPPEQFGDALRQSILKQMPNADAKVVDNAVNYAVKTMKRQGLEPSAASGLAIRAFRSVAKEQMLTLGKTTQFTGNKMRKVVSEQLNGRLLNDAHQQNFGQRLDSFVTERINVGLRGLNVTSALYELGDMANIFSNYGVKSLKSTKAGLGKIDGDTLYYSHKYGEADASYMTADMPQVKAVDAIWDNPNSSLASKIYQTYRTLENKLLAFRYVEQHKTELFFRTAEQFYRDKGLSGGELVNRVMSDYKATMLPHKLATANRIVGKMPNILTQYANWGLQATKRIGRTISGTNEAGKFADMDRAGRIARGIGTELIPKATAAAVLGVPLMQILGMRDFTGATGGDFTGISDEDKTKLDEVVKLLSLSPALSVGSNFYFADRRNDIADAKKAAGEEYGAERRPEDAPIEVLKQSGLMLAPFRGQYKKTKEVIDATKRGYYENRDGKIQAEAPTGLEAAQGKIFGKNYTQTIREYQDNPNIVSVLQGQAKPQDLITHNESVSNVIQNFGGTTPRDYNRPLTASITNPDGSLAAKGYSDMAKDAYNQAVKNYGKNSRQARTTMVDWIKYGREYNRVTDNLKRNNPSAHQTWVETKDDNIITPEKWKVYNGNRDVFEFDKQRKALEKRDLGRAIDPIYELPSQHVNEVLQERSALTGEDMKLRQLLYKKDWYIKFKDAESKYMDSFDGVRDDSGKTKRVQDWNKLNKDVFSPDGVITKYALVGQYQAEIDKFENYNSQERKDFTKSWYDRYGDEYTKQKENYDNERWNLVNEMRKLEGADPITFDDFKAKVEFPSDEPSFGFGNGKKKDTSLDPGKYAVSTKSSKGPSISLKTAKAGRRVTLKAQSGSPKVSIRKSKV